MPRTLRNLTDEELFKKYERGFQQYNVEEMITAKKEWHHRHKGEKFHPAYMKRIK
jgi:hypothetical protein